MPFGVLGPESMGLLTMSPYLLRNLPPPM